MQPDYNTYNYTNPDTQNPSPRRFLAIILGVFALLIIVIVVGSSLWNKYLNKVSVTLVPANGTTIEIGTPKDTEGAPSFAKSLAKTSSKMSVRVSPGTYLVSYTAKDRAEQDSTVTIEHNTTLTSPKLEYTVSKLAALLPTEKDAIHSALASQASTITLSRYNFKYEALYHDTSWYAASLVPTDGLATLDPQMVIMHKVSGAWKLVAGPKIILYVGDYTSIPSDIIRDINNRPVIDADI